MVSTFSRVSLCRRQHKKISHPGMQAGHVQRQFPVYLHYDLRHSAVSMETRGPKRRNCEEGIPKPTLCTIQFILGIHKCNIKETQLTI